MTRDLIAAFLLGGLVLFSFVTGAEFGDEIRRAARRVAGMVVPAREIWTFARRTPRGVETPAAAGGAPGAERARSSPQAPGAVPSAATPAAAHANRMWELSEPHLPPHPVNGRPRGEHPYPPLQPRPAARQPVPGTAALLAEEAAEARRAAYVRSQMRGAVATGDPKVLRRVLDGLRNLDERQPAFGEAPVARVLGLADLGPAGDRSFAERVKRQ